ncbi:glycosyltransferase family 4 protein [Kineococcus sp. SYSU DK004]|uniref:glycosyltransferase family 4 protein n=1 Tax=Kineococcus sp. SYSU DK004 TaxID=3383125 RepID=UPI003D7DD0E7
MRICFVSRRYWPAVSGMSVYAEKLLEELVRRGHDVVLVSQYRGDAAGSAVYGGGPPPADRVPAGVRAVGLEALGEQRVADGLPADFGADIATMRETVARLHEEEPFDLLHAQYAWPVGAAVLEASAQLGVPSVVSVQGGDGHWVGLCCREHSVGIRTVLDRADAVLIGSRTFADEVVEHHGTDPERFTLLGGATDTRAFTPPSEEAVGSLDRDGDGVTTLVFHGRVDRRKGVLDLLHALAALRAEGRPVRLVVSGIGPDVAAVAALVDELGLGGAVEQRGYVAYADAPSVYAGTDVFCSPTSSEGFSNTILEAMAAGLPVVTTRSVGVVDCVRDGENGLLHEVGDVAGLTDALRRLLDDPDLARELAGKALQEVRDVWSWPALTDRIEAVYERLAGTRPDTSWTALPEPERVTSAGRGVEPAADGDPCRFLAAPHLL